MTSNIDKELFNAVRNRDYQKLHNLLENGANPDTIDPDEEITEIYDITAFIYASMIGWEEGVKLLYSFGANINAKNWDGFNALHYLLMDFNFDTEQCNILRFLLSHGIEFDSPNKSDQNGMHLGETPIMVAAQYGNNAAIMLLHSYGANINRFDKENSTALYYAAANINIASIVLLLQYGANINIVCDDGTFTPLQRLIYYRCIVGVEILLKSHADPNMRNEYQQTALHEISQKRTSILLQDKRTEKLNIDEIEDHFSVRNKIAKLLLCYGGDLDPIDILGETPLMKALANGFNSLVKIFIDNGADISLCNEKQRSLIQAILSHDSHS